MKLMGTNAHTEVFIHRILLSVGLHTSDMYVIYFNLNNIKVDEVADQSAQAESSLLTPLQWDVRRCEASSML